MVAHPALPTLRWKTCERVMTTYTVVIRFWNFDAPPLPHLTFTHILITFIIIILLMITLLDELAFLFIHLILLFKNYYYFMILFSFFVIFKNLKGQIP